MKITIESGQADWTIEGFDFTAHRWLKNKDTAIIDTLWKVIRDNSETNFSNLSSLLREAYQNKIVRSKADLNYDENRFEVIRKGVFPSIMIYKKGE